MNADQIRQSLLPRAERDPRFREYVRRLSYPGLQTVAAIEIAVPILMQFGRLAMDTGSPALSTLSQSAAMMAVGLLTLGVSFLRFSRRHARLLAALSAWLAASLLTASAMWGSVPVLTTSDYVITGITIVVLTAVATVPFQPWQAMLLGLSI